MKKAFKLLAFIAILAPAAAIAQPKLTIQDGKIHNYYPEATVDTDCNIYFKNTGDSGLRIAYKKISVDYPSGWDVSLCDNRNCFFDFRDRDTFSALKAGEKTSIKITVFPKGSSDTAHIKYAVWDIANPGKIDTVEWNIYIRWAASVDQIEGFGWNISPNPAQNMVKVASAGLQTIHVINLQGQTVLTAKTNAASTDIDLSSLPAGQYFLRGIGAEVIRTGRIIKN
jgi:hypothetical protein